MLLNYLLVSYQDYYKDEAGGKHYDYPDIWTAFAKDSLMKVFLWVAVALAVVLIAVGIFVRFKRGEKFQSYLKTALALAVGFAVTVIVAMLALEFYDMKESEAVFDIVLWPAVTLGIVIVLGAAAIYVSTLYSKKAKKITSITALSVIGAALIAMLVCLIVYFASGNAEINNEAEITNNESLALYLCAAGLIVAIVLVAVFAGRGEKKGFDSKSISYASICIAMSFALSYLKIFTLPQSGSVTIASLLPLMIYSYMFGVRKGVFAGMIYGILQAVQEPWIIHPAQFLLDYPIAFAAIGLTGIFARVKKLDKAPQAQFALGAIVASIVRFLSHILSGVFAFSEYAYTPEGLPMNPWIYSMTYNSFVFADIAIVIAVGVLVFSSRSFMKQARRFRNAAPAEVPAGQTSEVPTEQTAEIPVEKPDNDSDSKQ